MTPPVPYLSLPLEQAGTSKRHPIQPSAMKRPIASLTTNETPPLFLPDSDGEEVPSTSTQAPLFLPEQEGEQQRRKKRRISSQAVKSRTLKDLWGPSQVSVMTFIPNPRILILLVKKASLQNLQYSSPPPSPGPSNSMPVLSQRYKKRGPHSKLGRKTGISSSTLLHFCVNEGDYIGSSKGKNAIQGSSSIFGTQTSHHIPALTEIIEISDSEEPNLPQSTGVNQALSKSPIPLPAAGSEVIEITSSEGEDDPQPPQSPYIQTFPIPPVSSPHEVERMMDVDDMVQHSPPLPPPPPLSLHIPQANSTIDAIEKTLSNVSVSSSPSHQTKFPHTFGSVEVSEPEEGLLADDDLHPPPPSSSSSPSHHMPLSGYPTLTVRHLIYGGPNGIFRDANASILQHIQTMLLQNPPSTSLTLPLESHQNREIDIQIPSTSDAIAPQIPTTPLGLVIAQVRALLPPPNAA